MAGAIQFKSEVDFLRHNIRFGLDQLAEPIGQALGISDLEWNWNHQWLPAGTCKYGHVYQVFRSKGLLLEPIRASELGGIRLAVNSGLLSGQHLSTANLHTAYERTGRLTTRWSRPGQHGVGFSAILALAGRAAHLDAVRRSAGPSSCATIVRWGVHENEDNHASRKHPREVTGRR